jgi:hypothetical protein
VRRELLPGIVAKAMLSGLFVYVPASFEEIWDERLFHDARYAYSPLWHGRDGKAFASH